MSGLKRKKKKSKIYFGKDVEDAIIRYNESDSIEEKNCIYDLEIRKAFHDLAKAFINIYGVYNTGEDISDIEHDTVAFLYQSMHKYTNGRGKAFSFFTVVTKNFVLQRAQSAHRKKMLHTNIENIHQEINQISHNKYNNKTENEVLKEFIEVIIEDFKVWSEKRFKKEEDYNIAQDIINILEKYIELDIYNKKQVFTYLKEMSNSNSKKIAGVLIQFRKRYEKTKNRYDSGRY